MILRQHWIPLWFCKAFYWDMRLSRQFSSLCYQPSLSTTDVVDLQIRYFAAWSRLFPTDIDLFCGDVDVDLTQNPDVAGKYTHSSPNLRGGPSTNIVNQVSPQLGSVSDKQHQLCHETMTAEYHLHALQNKSMASDTCQPIYRLAWPLLRIGFIRYFCYLFMF